MTSQSAVVCSEINYRYRRRLRVPSFNLRACYLDSCPCILTQFVLVADQPLYVSLPQNTIVVLHNN